MLSIYLTGIHKEIVFLTRSSDIFCTCCSKPEKNKTNAPINLRTGKLQLSGECGSDGGSTCGNSLIFYQRFTLYHLPRHKSLCNSITSVDSWTVMFCFVFLEYCFLYDTEWFPVLYTDIFLYTKACWALYYSFSWTFSLFNWCSFY